MEKLTWLANPYSPHVRHWVELLNVGFQGEKEVEIVHIYHSNETLRVGNYNSNFVTITCPLPEFFKHFPSFFQYIFLGLYIKLSGKYKEGIHAHNSSGYGLSALISGRKYILTTYGSEVYKAISNNINSFYRLLIKIILGRARVITTSSPQMTSAVGALCNESNVYEFSMGVSREFFYSQSLRNFTREKLNIPLDAVVIFSNRRLTRLYNIEVILEAFKIVSLKEKRIYLIQIEGDSDREYAKEILNITDFDNLLYIKGFLEQSELNSLLCASDYTISLPNTDQLSSSILEGICCKCLPILSNLEAYKPLCEISISVNADLKSLENTFIDILNGKYIKKYDLIDKYAKKYSIDNAALEYRNILGEFNA
ncbi:glycosyltransferase [Photobacterium leiognathi]|uniref:glycosyltransferase n=1 Tax=Photobacterium leiognathi TaxID=553611 RepID=UPI0029823D5B|nr:glycosyltransferase [Photobacterium leiognathi]